MTERSAAATAPATAIRLLARIVPVDRAPSDDLRRAVDFLDWSLRPGTLVAGGYGAGLLAGVLALPVVIALPLPTVGLVPSLATLVGLGTVHAVHRTPGTVAALRRTRALGDAPGVVGRAVMQMRIEPTAESAAAFAARTGEGPLSRSLDAAVGRAAGTPRSGLAQFGDRWSDWFPALRRATSLVVAAADAPPAKRDRTLDRAVDAVLDGTSDRMRSFASDVRGPATALYAFGVLLPLALVALLPAAGVAGVPVTLPLVVVLYDACLPILVACAGGWLLLRRPVAFPPAAVPRSHPERSASRAIPLLAGIGAGAGSLVAALAVLPAWSAPVLTVGVGAGTTLVLATRSVVVVRRRVRAVEENLPDALYLIGRRVAEGTAVETAVAAVADEVPGETGECLAAAAGVQDRLRVGIEAAFLGEHGALADLPSPRLESAARLLAAAASEGRPAGRAVVATADHLAEMARIEREARRDLARVTETLHHTGAAFGPLVAGATVRLAERMAATGFGGSGEQDALAGTGATTPGIDPAGLGLAVGAYVLALAVLLTALAVGLERGLDRALVGYRVGQSLVLAPTVFLAAYVGAGLLV